MLPWPWYVEEAGSLTAGWATCVGDAELTSNCRASRKCWERLAAERRERRELEWTAHRAYRKAVEAEKDAEFAAFVAAQAGEVAAFEAEYGSLDVDTCDVCGSVKIASEKCAECAQGEG